MTNYCFIHLEFGCSRREASLELLSKFRSGLVKKDDRVTLVIVDNARTDREESGSGAGFEKYIVLKGDNSNQEFSGWDVGVSAVLSSGIKPDVWIFSNDTAAWHHGWSDQRAARFASETQRLSEHAGPWILGEVNDFTGSAKTPLGPLLEYIVTYCFSMNEALRERLTTLSPGNAYLDSLVHQDFEPARKILRDHVDPGFAESRLKWVVAEDPAELADIGRKYKWARRGWHNASPLNSETFDSLRMKMRCVLSESLLSVRARQVGADIRSPYDARNGRERIRKTAQFIADKLWERRFLRKLEKLG